MSITVNWPAVPNTTGYVLYRNAGSPVNLGSLPADKVDVASGTTTYTYTTGVNNTLYYIVVGSKNPDGSVTYSEQLPIGYYPDTGPGPQTLLRGDWSFGYFGEVSPYELFTVPEIYTALIAQVGSTNAFSPNSNPVYSTFYKCIINGRIVFFPDNVYSASTTTTTAMQNAKLFVTDLDYANKGILMSKNGYDFIARAPHGSLNPLATVLPDYSQVHQSEFGMVYSLFGNANTPPMVPPTPGATSYAKYRLFDATPNSYLNGVYATALGASGSQYLVSNLNSGTISSSGTTGRPYVVFELLF